MAFRIVYQICNVNKPVLLGNSSAECIRRFRSLSPVFQPSHRQSHSWVPTRRRSQSFPSQELLRSDKSYSFDRRERLITTEYENEQELEDSYEEDDYQDQPYQSPGARRGRRSKSKTQINKSRTFNDQNSYERESRSEKKPAKLKMKPRNVASLNKDAEVKLLQYHLKDSKPSSKENVFDVFEYYSDQYRWKDTKVLPHLQPHNLKPYGTGENLLFPIYSTYKRKAIKYPILEPGYTEQVTKTYQRKNQLPDKIKSGPSNSQQRDYSSLSPTQQADVCQKIIDEYKKINPGYVATKKKVALSPGSTEEQNFLQKTIKLISDFNRQQIEQNHNCREHSDLGKCNQIISDYKRLNPDYAFNKQEEKLRFADEKEVVSDAQNFASAYKRYFHNNSLKNQTVSQIQVRENHENTETLDNSQPAETKEIKALSFHNILQKCTNSPVIRKKYSFTDVLPNLPQVPVTPVRVRVGPKANLLQSSAPPETTKFWEEVRLEKNERLVSPWPSYAEVFKNLIPKRKRQITYPVESNFDAKTLKNTANLDIKSKIMQIKIDGSTRSLHTNMKLTTATQIPPSNRPENIIITLNPYTRYSLPDLRFFPKRRYSSSSKGTLHNEETVTPKCSKFKKDPICDSTELKYSPDAHTICECISNSQKSIIDMSPIKHKKSKRFRSFNDNKDCVPLTHAKFVTKPKILPVLIPPVNSLYFGIKSKEECPVSRLKKTSVQKTPKAISLANFQYDHLPRTKANSKLKPQLLPITVGEEQEIVEQAIKKSEIFKPQQCFYDKSECVCPSQANILLKVKKKKPPKPQSNDFTSINCLPSEGIPTSRFTKIHVKKQPSKYISEDTERTYRKFQSVTKSFPKFVAKDSSTEPEQLHDTISLNQLQKYINCNKYVETDEFSKKENAGSNFNTEFKIKPTISPRVIPSNDYIRYRQQQKEDFPLTYLEKQLVEEPPSTCKNKSQIYVKNVIFNNLRTKSKNKPKNFVQTLLDTKNKYVDVKKSSKTLQPPTVNASYKRRFSAYSRTYTSNKINKSIRLYNKKSQGNKNEEQIKPGCCCVEDVYHNQDITPELQRLPKFKKDDIDWSKLRECAIKCGKMPRADANWKSKKKTLPVLKVGKCPCVESSTYEEINQPRLKRLSKFKKPDIDWTVQKSCRKPCGKMPRADDGVTLKKKSLPKIEINDCPAKDLYASLCDAPPLKRLEKFYKQDKDWKNLKKCIPTCMRSNPRADTYLKPRTKSLPRLKISKCPCVEKKYAKEEHQFKLKRLPKFEKPDIEWKAQKVCIKPCGKMPRADDSLKQTTKSLAKLRPSQCPCYDPRLFLSDTPPLRRLPKFEKPDIQWKTVTKCIPTCMRSNLRADHNLKHSEKQLPTLKPATCPCIERKFPDEIQPKLKRLPKFEKPDVDWKAQNTCIKPCGKMPRADATLKSKTKTLPKIKTTNCPTDPTPTSLCDVAPLKRLSKFQKQDIDWKGLSKCTPTCMRSNPRADHNLKPRDRSLPCLKASKCPCVEQKIPDGTKQPKLRRLEKFEKPDIDWTVQKSCRKPCGKMPRADDNLKYTKKSLPKLKPKECPLYDPCAHLCDFAALRNSNTLKNSDLVWKSESKTLRHLSNDNQLKLKNTWKFDKPRNNWTNQSRCLESRQNLKNLKNDNESLTKLQIDNFSYKDNFAKCKNTERIRQPVLNKNKKPELLENLDFTTEKRNKAPPQSKCKQMNYEKRKYISSTKSPLRKISDDPYESQQFVSKKSPYPSFSEYSNIPNVVACECSVPDIRILQPKYPILTETGLEPPPVPELIDIFKTNKCLMKKLDVVTDETKTWKMYGKESVKFDEKDQKSKIDSNIEPNSQYQLGFSENRCTNDPETDILKNTARFLPRATSSKRSVPKRASVRSVATKSSSNTSPNVAKPKKSKSIWEVLCGLFKSRPKSTAASQSTKSVKSNKWTSKPPTKKGVSKLKRISKPQRRIIKKNNNIEDNSNKAAKIKSKKKKTKPTKNISKKNSQPLSDTKNANDLSKKETPIEAKINCKPKKEKDPCEKPCKLEKNLCEVKKDPCEQNKFANMFPPDLPDCRPRKRICRNSSQPKICRRPLRIPMEECILSIRAEKLGYDEYAQNIDPCPPIEDLCKPKPNPCKPMVDECKPKPELVTIKKDVCVEKTIKCKPKTETKSKEDVIKLECKPKPPQKQTKCRKIATNCPPKARNSCEIEYVFKECKGPSSPYPSFSECRPPFPKEKINECVVAKQNAKNCLSKINMYVNIKPAKNKCNEEEKPRSSKCYSTMTLAAKALAFRAPNQWKRNFSSGVSRRGSTSSAHILNAIRKTANKNSIRCQNILNQRLLPSIEEGIKKMESQNTDLLNNPYCQILKAFQQLSEREIHDFSGQEHKFNQGNVGETVSSVSKLNPKTEHSSTLTSNASFESNCVGISDVNAELEKMKVVEAFKSFCNRVFDEPNVSEVLYEESEQVETEAMQQELDELLKKTKLK